MMYKVLQAKLQQYINQEFPDIKAGFRKVRGIRDQIANIHWITEKATEFRKKSTSDLDYARGFHCVDDNKLWKILEKMYIPDLFSCLLRNL